MENTNTIDQGAADARASLMSSIQQGQDYSQFKDSSSSESPAVAETTLNNPSSESRSTSEAAETVLNPTPSQPAKEGATNVSNEVATNQTDTQTPQAKPRAPGRIQELLELNKVKEAKLQEYEKKIQEIEAKQKDPAKASQPEYLIPQPTPPTHSKDVLAQLLQKAKSEGNQELFDQVQEQYEAWRQHEMKMIEWKIDHKEAVNRHNSNVEFYKQEAFKIAPELKDPNSPVSKEYIGIRGWAQKELPEALKKPVSEYFMAQVAKWKQGDESKSARLVAIESELKKTKEEIQSLKKGSMPLDSKTRTELGANTSPDSSLSDAKSSLLKGIQDFNRTSSFATL
jgi:hypothetical protein